MELFCSLLPKVELHSHINGSCSEETISKLIRKKKLLDPCWQLSEELNIASNGGSLERCFSTFKLIHELCDNEEAAYLVTSDVIKEFAKDNVKYLELRTTPRDVSLTRMTKSSYIESVLKAISDARSSMENDIIVKLLLSIDRAMKNVEDAQEVLKLIKMYSADSEATVVGVDFSGNPTIGDVKQFLPLLQLAKQNHMKLSLHMAEVARNVDEIEGLLALLPDRIGHATFLLPHYLNGRMDFINTIITHKIPLEMCLTSNVKSGTVMEYSKHQFNYWFQRNHPCVLCTDDKGVFSTSLSNEYFIAAETFGLTSEVLYELSYSSIDYIFSDDCDKNSLKNKWRSFKTEH